MPQPKLILVLRFSAMGDVAMTVPVIKTLLVQNPDLQVTYVSRPAFARFFENIPRLNFVAADIDKDFNGLAGIFKLFSFIKKQGNYDAVADLHDVLRTKIIRRLFSISGLPFAFIDKGRAEKKLLTRFPNKVLKPLKRTAERYADVFRNLSFPLTLDYSLVKEPKTLTDDIIKITGEKVQPWVGISPFAKHTGKIYPLDKMEEVVTTLSAQNIRLFVFGGSVTEQEIGAAWALKYPHLISVIKRLNMEQELILMNNLEVMVAMDSAGSHLASLEGTPVVSIWGATHHYAGFLGYGQSENDVVADDIECRPCSIFGDKPCFRGDYACMHRIEPLNIVNAVLKFIF